MRTERSTWAWLAALGAAALALGLQGCPGTLDDKQRFLLALADASDDAGDASDDAGDALGEAGASSGPCGDVPTRIFTASCGGTGCHGSTASQQGLDLESPGVASRVVGVAAKACPGTLADPTDPEHSLLYTKLAPNQSCGAQMPLARPPLSSADAACVLAWIAAQ